jgi:hypothetical protein
MELMSLVAGSVPHILAPSPCYADNFMVCALLASTFVLAAVLSDRKYYLLQLLKDFFLPHEIAIEGVRTTRVVYLRLGMYAVGLTSATQLLVICAKEHAYGSYGYGKLALLVGVAIVLLYLLRMLLFFLTDCIFFDRFTAKAWEQSCARLALLASIPFYLLTVAAVFFDLPSNAVVWMLFVLVILLEICLLYKAFHIFSSKKYGILQIFVYLCALELMPLLVIGKALVLFV